MKPRIAIIGGGAAGLSFATQIDTKKYDVLLFEKKNRLGSKLLVAGKGGFNLTHSENLDILRTRYQPASLLDNPLSHFNNTDLMNYFSKMGIQTFIGSSKRIFPQKPIKPIEVLNAIELEIAKNKVITHTNAEWISLSKKENTIHLEFNLNGKLSHFTVDYVVFALGGASWSVTGSTGDWLEKFNALGISTGGFQPSNCAVEVNWKSDFIQKYAGFPLKNIGASINNQSFLGEIMITDFGLEGTPIYALSREFRTSINQKVKPLIFIDFKPTVNAEKLKTNLKVTQVGTWTQHIEKQLKLSKVQMALLKNYTTKAEFQNIDRIIELIKHFPLQIEKMASIEEAISTVGGVLTNEVNKQFEFNHCKNVFAIGEMLDWDAPTGGYLIQGCMSMGQYVANYFNQLK